MLRRRLHRDAVLVRIQCTWRKVQARFGSISAGPFWPQCFSSPANSTGW
jgi:hypothetical protein